MGIKKLYNRTKKALTSEKAKKNYKTAKKVGAKLNRYFNTVGNNIDETFSIPAKKPDYVLSNRNKRKVKKVVTYYI